MSTSWLETTTTMTQRSNEWYEWRKRHIGASDVPAIMNEGDFGTPLDLWLVKTGKKPPFAGNEHTQRGIDAEPIIKKLYEDRVNCSVDSPVLEWAEWPILSASLDGYNADLKLLAEFKYPSAAKHALAKLGSIPKTYKAQLQTQMLVAGVDRMDYVSYDGEGIVVVEVLADKAYQARIVDACKAFWKCVVDDVEPPSKYVSKEGAELQALSYNYANLLLEQREIEAKLYNVKKAIADLVPDSRASFYGLKFTRSSSGSIILKRG